MSTNELAGPAQLILGPNAQLVATDPALNLGVFFCTFDAPIQLWFSDGQAWRPAIPTGTVTTDIHFFLDAVNGSDTNSGTSANAAWKSYDPLLAFMRRTLQYTGAFTIQDVTPGGPGAFSCTAAGGPIIANVPRAVGELAQPITFIGQRKDTGLGIRTVGAIGSAIFAGQACGQITDAAGAVYVANAETGASIRILDGLAAGICATIAQNSTSVLTSVMETFPGLAPGDHYVIEQAGSTLLVPAGTSELDFIPNGPGRAGLFFYAWKITGAPGANATVAFQNLDVLTTLFDFDGSTLGASSSLRQTGGSWVSSGSVFLMGDGTNVWQNIPTSFLPRATNFHEGAFLHDTVAFWSDVHAEIVGVGLNLQHAISGDTRFTIFGSFHQPTLTGQPTFAIGSAADFVSSVAATVWFFPHTTGPILSADGVSIVSLGGFQVVSNVYGTASDGIVGNHGSQIGVTNATSAPGTLTGVGLRIENQTQAYVPDANVSTTITGAGGDVAVGSNTADTWLNIQGGLAQHTTDYHTTTGGVGDASSTGVLTSQGCRVSNV